MLGNVYEWCQDRMDGSTHPINGIYSDTINMSASTSEKNPHVHRGGAYDYPPSYVRSASSFVDAPSHRVNYIGFRPSRTYR